MGKRKLRPCTNCGGRHGPPTGKSCRQSVEEKPQKIAEEKEDVASDRDLGAVNNALEQVEFDSQSETSTIELEQESKHVPFSSFKQQDSKPDYEGGAKCQHPWAGDEAEASRGRPRHQTMSRRQRSPDWYQGRVPASSEFEERISGKVEHMENLLGRVAGVQQAQLQRLIDLSLANSASQSSAPKQTTESAQAEPIRSTPPSVEKVKAEAAELEFPLIPEYSTEKMAPAEEEWREYHGEAMWLKEKEKKRKNPFDHNAYLKKGDEVDSFETLMVITFKTLKQLVDQNFSVKGLIRHGRSLAEKAAKGSYKKNALIGYDESVRERAGEVGPF